MPMISFVSEQIEFICQDQQELSYWLISVCKQEGKNAGEITYIFCSDDYLLNINQQFLQHDHLTDVITFDYSEENTISGDIFISIDRVEDNALSLDIQIVNELHRVMVHGLLHLLGYGDKTAAKKITMTSREDFYLSLRSF